MGQYTRFGASYSSSCAATLSATLSRPYTLGSAAFASRTNQRAVATEYSSVRFGDELRRRRRIVSRSLYGLWTAARRTQPIRALFFCIFRCFPTKLLRWLVPGVAVGGCSRSIFHWSRTDTTRPLARAASGFLRAWAALGLLLPERLGRYWLFYVPAYFTATNWGTLLGLLSFLTGRRHRVWQPAR